MDGQLTDGPARRGSRVPGQRGGVRAVADAAAPGYARPRRQRAGILLGVLAIEGIAAGIAFAGFFPDSAHGASGSGFWVPFGQAVTLAASVILGVHLVAFAFLAPIVSYRPYDTFFLLVPVVSVVFWFRVVWRLTALPERYWPPRDEELPVPPIRAAAQARRQDASSSR